MLASYFFEMLQVTKWRNGILLDGGQKLELVGSINGMAFITLPALASPMFSEMSLTLT